mmetsp:Transcript_72159/g.141536  ORF Transcript_72159/g.141536 Transcript_72159/m.141536 type:complete len:92 (+) Transcript_72159:62-337(+)
MLLFFLGSAGDSSFIFCVIARPKRQSPPPPNNNGNDTESPQTESGCAPLGCRADFLQQGRDEQPDKLSAGATEVSHESGNGRGQKQRAHSL